MILVNIDNEIVDWAKDCLMEEDIKTYRALNKYGSEEWRIIEGDIGQAAVMRYLKLSFSKSDSKDYDFIYNGIKYEVKTIAERKQKKPDPEKDWAVVNSNKDDGYHIQKCDRYIFVRLKRPYTRAWIVGWMSNKEFWEKSIKKKKGDYVDGFKMTKCNMAIILIKHLHKASYNNLRGVA